MLNTLNIIGQKLRLVGEIYSFEAITMGNINATYKVTYKITDETLNLISFKGVF
jgi:hypothetical protein